MTINLEEILCLYIKLFLIYRRRCNILANIFQPARNIFIYIQRFIYRIYNDYKLNLISEFYLYYIFSSFILYIIFFIYLIATTIYSFIKYYITAGSQSLIYLYKEDTFIRAIFMKGHLGHYVYSDRRISRTLRLQ